MGGKVIYKDEKGDLTTGLVRFDGPIFKIPMLAIHLNREMGSKFEWNNETHLKAILGTTTMSSLSEDKSELTDIDKV